VCMWNCVEIQKYKIMKDFVLVFWLPFRQHGGNYCFTNAVGDESADFFVVS